ncbi:MAG: Crp/Fnr family transcriptional regulator [Prolixibacteraceae bacterium]|nr:Crp/Fnr family transcriptional regulator [Prolixibacteraceae bacterium]
MSPRIKYECSCVECKLKTLFFDKVETSQLELVCSSKIEHQYQKGEFIIREGDFINDFIYLKSGLVKLTRQTADDKEQILSFAKPFDFVSLLSVFSSKRYHYSVIALENTSICILSLDDVKKTILQNGLFSLNLMEKLSEATDNIILDNLEIKRKHLRGRVAHVLIYFSEFIYGKKTIQLPVSRKEIAEYIGMTTENVIRTLSEFKKDGIIRTYGKDIDIVDHERLKAISQHG